MAYRFNGNPGIKDPIEVFGVPHTEVYLIIVNGESVGFDYQLKNRDRVAVYPVLEGIEISQIVKLREVPLRSITFIVDVNLGKLARLLRLFGFDTLFANSFSDKEIAAISATDSKYLAIGRSLSDAGFAVVRFDFSGCGETTAPYMGTLLNTRIRDLQATLDYVQKQPWTNGQLGLLGSSLGGYLAMLAAARTDQVHAVVCWATPFDLAKVQDVLKSARTPPQMVSPGMELGSPVNLSELPAIRRALVVHGQLDETVNWQEGL